MNRRECLRQYLGMRLDHVSYACASGEIADVVQRIGSDLGVTFIDGGRHPAFGTRNFTAALGGGCYIEVVSALDHPAALKAFFGRAVHARVDAGGGWLTWVVAVEDIRPIEERLGRPSTSGSRIRPDGSQLRWKQIGVMDIIESPGLPFFVEWESPASEHPSASGARVTVSSLVIAGDPHAMTSLPEPVANVIPIEWVDDGSFGVSAVYFNTPHGSVRVD